MKALSKAAYKSPKRSHSPELSVRIPKGRVLSAEIPKDFLLRSKRRRRNGKLQHRANRDLSELWGWKQTLTGPT